MKLYINKNIPIFDDAVIDFVDGNDIVILVAWQWVLRSVHVSVVLVCVYFNEMIHICYLIREIVSFMFYGED